jgi:hypothetical protein
MRWPPIDDAIDPELPVVLEPPLAVVVPLDVVPEAPAPLVEPAPPLVEPAPPLAPVEPLAEPVEPLAEPVAPLPEPVAPVALAASVPVTSI